MINAVEHLRASGICCVTRFVPFSTCRRWLTWLCFLRAAFISRPLSFSCAAMSTSSSVSTSAAWKRAHQVRGHSEVFLRFAYLSFVCYFLLRSGVSACHTTRFAHTTHPLCVFVLTVLFLGRGVIHAGGHDLHAEWNKLMRAKSLAAGEGNDLLHQCAHALHVLNSPRRIELRKLRLERISERRKPFTRRASFRLALARGEKPDERYLGGRHGRGTA